MKDRLILDYWRQLSKLPAKTMEEGYPIYKRLERIKTILCDRYNVNFK